jgi:NAD-dependent SIR2 family protein deacetylase
MNDKTPTQKKGPQIRGVTNLAQDLMRARGNKIDSGKAVFLIGAGCSASAGIPIGRELAKLAARKLADCYSHGQLRGTEPEHALNWLKGHGYICEEITWDNLYGVIFEDHFRSPQEQQEIVRQAISEGRGFINWAHLCLGELIRERYIHTVLTTNFDQLVLEGIVRTGIIPVVADGIESLTRIDSKPMYPQVVHLHGSLHTYKVRNSRSDVEETANYATMQRAIYQLLHDSHLLVVVGYAGGEEGVMFLLHKAVEMEPDNVIYWVSYSSDPDKLSDYAKKLLNGKNKFLILGQDADTFFAELANSLKIGAPKWLRDPTK